MTQKIVNLRDLFVVQGREMYNVSKRVTEELPGVISKVTNPEVKRMLERELSSSSEQCEMIENIFSEIKESPVGETPVWSNWLFSRTMTIVNNTTDPVVCDAAIVNCVSQICHNKITGFGCMSSYAKEIGYPQVSERLTSSVQFEKDVVTQLSRTITGITRTTTEPTTV